MLTTQHLTVGGFVSPLSDLFARSPVHAKRADSRMIIADYFAGLERTLRRNPQVSKFEEPFTCLASDDFNGLVRGRVFFWDGSDLDLYEVISTELGYPVRISYAYTYLKEGRRIFRYDNAPHHPEIVTFLHHKHIGPQDRLTPADQLGLNSVLQEVAAWLTAQ